MCSAALAERGPAPKTRKKLPTLKIPVCTETFRVVGSRCGNPIDAGALLVASPGRPPTVRGTVAGRPPAAEPGASESVRSYDAAPPRRTVRSGATETA